MQHESGAEFNARIRAFVASLPAAGRVLAVSHFGVIRQIVGQYIGFRDAPQAIGHCTVMQLHVSRADARLVVVDQHLRTIGA